MLMCFYQPTELIKLNLNFFSGLWKKEGIGRHNSSSKAWLLLAEAVTDKVDHRKIPPTHTKIMYQKALVPGAETLVLVMEPA